MPDLPKRDKAEKALMLLLLPEFEQQTAAMLRAGLRPVHDAQWWEMRTKMASAIEDQLRRNYQLAAILMLASDDVPLAADDIGGAYSTGLIRTRAKQYGLQRSLAVADAVTASVRRRHLRLIQEAEANAMAAEEVAERIEAILSKARAEGIAATETTAATSAGEGGVAELSRALGGPVIRAHWNTERDKRVCPICYPLHGRYLTDVPVELQAGPPAHPLCRCWLTWVRVEELVGVGA